MKLLVDRREDLVRERTRTINRLRWHLHRIAPGDADADPKPKSLNQVNVRRRLAGWLADRTGIDARLARDILADIDRITPVINAREKELTALVKARVPQLLEISGCAALTAAKIAGETAGVPRFASEATYARHAGVAPIPVWSGQNPRPGRREQVRPPSAQHRTAPHRLTQLQRPSLGRTYDDKRTAAGGSTTEALRALKRLLARVVYQTLENNPSTAAGALLPTAG